MTRIKNFLRRGPFYSLGIIFNKLIPEWLFRMRYFVIYQLANPNHSTREIHQCVCSWCDQDETEQAERMSRFTRRMFNGPVKASIAKVEGKTVGAFWVAEDFFDEFELGIRYILAHDQRWLFGAMVRKENRGQGVFPELLRFTCRQLSHQGGTQQLASVNPFNRPSKRVFSQHAQGLIGSVVVVRLFRWNWCVCRGRCHADQLFSFNCKKKPIQLKLSTESCDSR